MASALGSEKFTSFMCPVTLVHSVLIPRGFRHPRTCARLGFVTWGASDLGAMPHGHLSEYLSHIPSVSVTEPLPTVMVRR